MKPILFRGKRVDNGDWIYGGYYEWSDTPYIIQRDIWDKADLAHMVEVDPQTVGQFVYTSHNKKDVYVGDIVHDDPEFECCNSGLAVVEWHKNPKGRPGTIVARYIINPEGYGDYNFDDLHVLFEPIGNIHDNPDLLTTTE